MPSVVSKMAYVPSPFSKTKIADDLRSIELYGKKDATWEQMNAWLEENYGDHGKDVHWKWRGFGQIGTEEFCVVLLRRPCSTWLCDAEDNCEKCGDFTCELTRKRGKMLCARNCA